MSILVPETKRFWCLFWYQKPEVLVSILVQETRGFSFLLPEVSTTGVHFGVRNHSYFGVIVVVNRYIHHV